ncbi:MAG: polysulfide reductase NrfD [Acidihalobacter sp.]|uniref:NrfD/PsrC family molybdoenzyme membrane anchor subunit n=1 Tax=Acidihalobacter sp. TaxID=1872108 RepID=UPI00307DE14A
MNETLHLLGTVTTQNRWAGLVIWYLFLGGLGAALVAISIFSHRYYKASARLTLWGVISGEVGLAVGSLLLLFHLLDPSHAWRVLLPWNVFLNPTAWITWGTQFLIWAMVFGLLYIWPILREPKAGGREHRVAEICRRFAGPLAWLTIVMSIAVAVYTGLLLRSFPAVALWHNPVIPMLFTVSALSTGLAYLLLVQYAVLREHGPLARAYERFDILLIVIEMILIGFLLYGVLPGSGSGRASAELLMGNMGWVVGFLVLGLLVPLLLEIKGSLRAWNSPAPVMLAAVLVLIGGYLLRHYFLTAGVYYFPWTNAHHLGVLGSDVVTHVLH